MDLSKFSDSDLEALKTQDLSRVSDAGLALLHGGPSITPDTGFTGALKAGKESILADYERLKGKTGIKDVREAEQAAQEHETKRGQIFKPTEEGWTEAPWQKFKETAGGSLPYMALPIAAGIGAATLPLTGTAATIAGLGATGLASAAQFTGSNLSRKVQAGQSLEEASLLEAGAAAIPQAALDVIGLRMIPGIRGILGKAGVQITEEQAAKLAQRSLLEKAGSVALTTGKTMGTEGLTETGQQVLERLQAGLSITDEQARKEYYDSFIGGAVLGGTLGTAGQAFESKKIIPNAPTPTPEAPPPSGQLGLGLEGGVETTGPRISTVAQEAAPDNVAQIREQYDTLEREMDRLKEAHAATSDLQEKKTILEQAQKLDFARQELAGQLEGAAPRTAAPEAQGTLDFEQPYPKTRLQAEPTIIGQETIASTPQANLDLEFAKQRLAAGAPLTPTQELMVRQDQAAQRVAQEAAPIPEIAIPQQVGGAGVPSSYKVTDNAIDTFGVTKGATKFKQAVRGLDLMNPEDAAKFDKLVEQHERKGAKIDMDAVEAFRSEKPEPVAAREVPEQAGLPAVPYDARKGYQQAREANFAFGQTAAPLSPRDITAQTKAEYDGRTGAEPINGPTERGVQLPSVGLQTPAGTTTPEVTGMGSAVGATTPANRGTGVLPQAQPNPLAQMAQQVAPATAPDITQEEVARVSTQPALEDQLAQEPVSADTEELMRQLGIAKAQRPNLQGGTTQVLQDKVFQGDIKGALKAIVDGDPKQFTPLDKEVAKRLLASKTLPKIEVVDQSAIEDGAPAQYNPNTDTVQIAQGQVDSHTVLHETVHGFLHVMIHDSNVRKVKGLAPNPMLKGLQDVYDHVKDNPALVEQYGLKDLSEFTSEAMSNPEFQVALSKIPYKRMNVFTAFGRAVLKALGIPVEGNVAQTDALTAALIAVEQIMPQGRNVQEAVGARTQAGTVAAPKLERLTKLEAAPNVGQKIKDSVKAVYDADKGDAWTKFRVAVIDPASGLAKRLSSLPLFSNGQLRADMLHHQYAQVNNIVNNGIQSGVPILNADGSVIIKETTNNLARSNEIATSLNNNPNVKSWGGSGMEYVAEIARILRGKEIITEDNERRRIAIDAIQTAEKKLKDARKKSITGAQAIKLNNQAKALQAKYKDDVEVNREKQVTPAHIAWAEAQVKAVPQAQEVLNIWKSINEALIKLREDGGLISTELADTLRKNNSYVPLFAAEEDLEAMRDPNVAISGTGAKSVSQLHKLKGSELTRNIWENLYKQYAITTAAVFQNQVRKVGIEQLASLDAAEITQNAKDPKVNVRFRDANSPFADSNGIVNAIVDNPNELAAFQMMHYQLTPVMKGMAGATKLLRAGALINPMYWVKQLIRDPLHASIVGGYVVTPADSIKEYINILRGNSEEAKILAHHGAFGAVDSTVDLQTFLKGIGTEKTTATNMDKVLHQIMRMHEASDAATRVAIYKKAFADAISKGMSKEEATTFAVMKARESANFSVHGNSQTLNSIRQMIPFFSAAITSLDTVYRAATGYGLNPKEKAEAKRMFYSRAVMMTIMTMAYAAMLQGDEDYQKLPDDVKDGNWLMPNPIGGGHSFIRIPVPFEVGFLFKTVPEAAIRALAGNSTGKEVLVSYLSGVLQNLPGNGLIIPQAAKPILETMTNHSFFTGRTIESMSDQNVRVGLRGQNASEVAKILSNLGLDKISLSPAKIDNIIQGYTAQLGTFAANAADAALIATEGKSVMSKNIEQMPGFKTFMTNPNTSKAVGDFYTLQHEAVEAVNEFNKLKKSGDREGMLAFLENERNKKLVTSEPTLRKIQTQLTTISNQAKLIKNNEKLDPDVRLQKVNALMAMYDKVAQQMNVVLKAAKLEK